MDHQIHHIQRMLNCTFYDSSFINRDVDFDNVDDFEPTQELELTIPDNNQILEYPIKLFY